jgi:hypothetical protein
VDEQVSLSIGRDVYGWPKVAGHVESIPSLWDNNPTAGNRVFSFSTHALPRRHRSEVDTRRTLLEIDVEPQPTYSVMPMNPGDIWAPWNVMGQMTTSCLSLMGDALDMTLGLRLRGYQSERDVPSLLRRSERAMDYLRDVNPALRNMFWWQGMKGSTGRSEECEDEATRTMQLKNITVKQFRDAAMPHMACYQALVESCMGIQRVNRAGLLGDLHLLRGDSSGGYSIRIHNYSSHPIIDALGLQVDATEKISNGAHVSTLKPILPYWSNFDLSYGLGKKIFEQTLPLNRKVSLAQDPDFGFNFSYNTSLGSAAQPVEGPFHMPDVTLQVYPLEADGEKIRTLVENYFPSSLADLDFKPAGRHVYLVVQVVGDEHGKMWSATRNVEWWNQRSVQFCVPVKCFRKKRFTGFALVSPYIFADSGRATMSDREVNGRPTLEASIDSPPDVWLNESGPVRPRKYLSLKTEAFEGFGQGDHVSEQTLIEIASADALDGSLEANVPIPSLETETGEANADTVARNSLLEQKTGGNPGTASQQEDRTDRPDLLKMLADTFPIHWYTLKQYRDSDDSRKACYQALVDSKRTIKKAYDLRLITERVHIAVHRFPSLPIVDVLGLQVEHADSRQDRQVIQILSPVNPFWMRISMDEELGQVVGQWSEGGNQWDCIDKEGAEENGHNPSEPASSDEGERMLGWLQRCLKDLKLLDDVKASKGTRAGREEESDLVSNEQLMGALGRVSEVHDLVARFSSYISGVAPPKT